MQVLHYKILFRSLEKKLFEIFFRFFYLCMCTVHVYCACVSWYFVSFRFVSFRFVSFRFVSFCFVSFHQHILIQQVTGIQSNSRSGEMTTRMMIKLPTCIIKDILSYFEMDLYQGKRGNWYIFNEGVYDSLKLMFPKVRIRVMKSTQPVYDVEESVWRTDEILYTKKYFCRPRASVKISSKTRNGIQSPDYSIDYKLHIICEHRVNCTTHQINNITYYF